MGGTTRTLGYGYDVSGNRTRITHPDGAQFDYAYDALGRPTTLTDPALALNHSYEPWGPVNAILRIGGASGRWTTPDGRLISLSHYNGPSFTLDTYWAFTHNPAGQIATQWGMSDAYAWTGHYGVQRPYTTNGLNQYSQTGSGAATAAFTYDANGNLITQTVQSITQTYVYDVENRLVGAPGNVVLTYDPLGRLYSVSSPTTDTRFVYDGDALVAEHNAAGTLQRRYVHDVGADVPVIQYEGATVSSSTRRYLLANAQGSIVASTDGNSVIQTRNTYDEYGIPGVGNLGRFQYTGQAWIPELGMYHYKARIYSPTLGRFLQTDPIGYEDQFNLYAYVGNDPINATDPSGRQGILETTFRRGLDMLSQVNSRSHSPSHNNNPSGQHPIIKGLETSLSMIESTMRDAGLSARELRPLTALTRSLPGVGGAITFSHLRSEGHSVPASAAGAAAREGTSLTGAEIGAAIGTFIEPGIGTVAGAVVGWTVVEFSGLADLAATGVANLVDRVGTEVNDLAHQGAEAFQQYISRDDPMREPRGTPR